MKFVFQMRDVSPRQHITASSTIDSALFGITRFSSMPSTLPNPSQVGHAPIGLLKLNIWSDGSLNVIPSSSNWLEKVCSLIQPSVHTFKIQIPLPSEKAVSKESVIRLIESLSCVMEMRSINKWQLLSIFSMPDIMSDISMNCPSDSTRENPSLA